MPTYLFSVFVEDVTLNSLGVLWPIWLTLSDIIPRTRIN